VAETYGDGSVRLTCEENILFVNVPNDKLPEMLADPLFTKFKVNPGGCCFALRKIFSRAILGGCW
jgi:ferredoxin-nitrite reductase